MTTTNLTPRIAAVIEDAAWLIDIGEHPEQIAHRLGYANRKNLETVLYRHGRPDLVAAMAHVPRTAAA